MQLRARQIISAFFGFLLAASFVVSNVFAANIIVQAKTDKSIYKPGESIIVTVEVQNLIPMGIVSGPTPTYPWSGDISKGNLTYELYKNNDEKWGPGGGDVTTDLLGSGYLWPLMVKQNAKDQAITIPPNSTAAVGQGDPFERIMVRPYPYPDKTGRGAYVMKIRFSGKVNSQQLVGYSIITFQIQD